MSPGRNEVYKKAFADVFGDPFAAPEPKEGHYNHLLGRSEIMAVRNNFDEGRATANPARPNKIDFFVDVENAVEDALQDAHQIAALYFIYVEGVTTYLKPEERHLIELKVGKVLLERGISPVSRYFIAVRKPVC